MAKVRIKKDDMVLVISGKDRDLTKPRRVLQVMPREQRVLVEGVNMIKRHTRPNPQRNIRGGIVERESPIHISNVMLVCPRCNQRTRVGFARRGDEDKVRVCKKCDEAID